MNGPEDARLADYVRPGWHGWGTDAWSLHVGPLPGRKSVCLYYESGCTIDALAYFRDDESAFRALAILDRLVHGSTDA